MAVPSNGGQQAVTLLAGKKKRKVVAEAKADEGERSYQPEGTYNPASPSYNVHSPPSGPPPPEPNAPISADYLAHLVSQLTSDASSPGQDILSVPRSVVEKLLLRHQLSILDTRRLSKTLGARPIRDRSESGMEENHQETLPVKRRPPDEAEQPSTSQGVGLEEEEEALDYTEEDPVVEGVGEGGEVALESASGEKNSGAVSPST